MKHVLTILGLFIFCAACKQPVKMEQGVDVFGEDFKVENVTAFGDVVNGLKTQEEIETVMQVQIDKVCKVKGCWMTATPIDDEQGEFFVKFKDYGFFVPVDMVDNGARQVYMKGKAYKETTSVDELRHYAEDEGKSREEIAKITQPEVQYKFMATGVKLL